MHENQLILEISKHTDFIWFIAMGASEFVSAPIDQIETINLNKLIEIRAFSDLHELKAVRGNLGDDFQLRDSANHSEISTTEVQYLDIDTTKGFTQKENAVTVTAIGAGKYDLPHKDYTKVKIEHYYRADGKGIYHPFDYRIVKFLREEEVE